MQRIKKFTTLICLCFCALSTFAQNYNSAQEALRSQISSELSRQGYNPENQNDGLKFKNEGANYYIEIDKHEENPMYIRLCRYVKFDDKLTRNNVINNISKYNAKFGVKVSCQEKQVVISSEMFLTKATEFTYVFDTLLSQVKNAYITITE